MKIVYYSGFVKKMFEIEKLPIDYLSKEKEIKNIYFNIILYLLNEQIQNFAIIHITLF